MFLGINLRVVVNHRLLFFRIYFVSVHAASHDGDASMGTLPFIHPRYQDKAVSRDVVWKKSTFPERQSPPVLLGCCCVWTGREGGCSPPHPHPPTPLKDRKRKEKQKSVTGRLLSHRCHCDGAPQAEQGEGGWGLGRDSLTSLLFLVISSACGER